MREDEQAIQEVAQEIRKYFAQHPDAADTLDGIVRWWLRLQRYVEARSAVSAALDQLVAEEELVKVTLTGGEAVYRKAHDQQDSEEG